MATHFHNGANSVLPELCQTKLVSRICERGTKGCTVHHDTPLDHPCHYGCQYAKDVGMLESTCAHGCIYEQRAGDR